MLTFINLKFPFILLFVLHHILPTSNICLFLAFRILVIKIRILACRLDIYHICKFLNYHDTYLGNCLIEMYANCDRLDEALSSLPPFDTLRIQIYICYRVTHEDPLTHSLGCAMLLIGIFVLLFPYFVTL